VTGRARDAAAPGSASRAGALGVVALAACLALLVTACSVRRFAADRIGAALAAGGVSWGEDDDPQLIAEALPFALKSLEGLVAESPDNPDLLLATCRGFVTYSGGFVQPRAEALPPEQFEVAREISQRALRLDLRALGYCRRALELRLPGSPAALARTPGSALTRAVESDVALLYWTGAAWGSAISLGTDRPELVADLPAVRALFDRASALDPGFDRGAIQEAMIRLDALPEFLGGSRQRALEDRDRAVELSGGLRAGPWVAWAASAAVAAQDRAGFRSALDRALAVDPEASPPDRLANRIAQDRARALLARVDDLFYAGEEN
jgi:predicted anti-sigma-YlaC factor YlaD